MSGLNISIVGNDPQGEQWLHADPGLQVQPAPGLTEVIVVLGRGQAQIQALEAAISHGLPVVLHRIPTEARVVELARTARAPIFCWRGHRLLPSLIGLRRDIFAGKIGLPTDLTLQFWLPAPAHAEADPTPLLANAVDAAVWLTGCAPLTVYKTSTVGDGPVCLATTSLMLKDHVPATLTAGWAWGLSSTGGVEPTVRVTAIGTHGLLHVSSERPAHVLSRSDGRTESILYPGYDPRQPAYGIRTLLAQSLSASEAADEVHRAVSMMNALMRSTLIASVETITGP